VTSYRWIVIEISHYLPTITFGIDIMINKIRIPWHHIFFTIALTAFYFLMTYIYQISLADEAIYFNSLNWNCESDFSYLQTRDTNMTISGFEAFPCNSRQDLFVDNITVACRPLYQTYYCHQQNKFTPT
jgi:hypothetical protein